MPDWSYHPLNKTTLHTLQAKHSRTFIHRAMRTVSAIPGGKHFIEFLGHNQTSPALQQTFHETLFPSPIGLSGKVDPHMIGSPAFQQLGFGFLEIGPVVLHKPVSQLPPQWQNGQIAFSKTPEKLVLKDAIKQLIQTDFHLPMLARLDESLCADALQLCMQQLAPFVAGFFLTAAQIKQLEKSQTFIIYQIVEAAFADKTPILNQVRGIVLDAPMRQEQSYFVEKEHALLSLQQAIQHLKEAHPQLPIITNGGIETPAQALALQQAGADLMLLSEGYVKAGPGLPKRIHERLLYEQVPPEPRQPWFWSFVFGLAILVGGFIALYFAFTSVILRYDEAFIGLSREQLLGVNSRILDFMAHDRMSLAGTMISAGILYMALAYFGLRRHLHWAKIAFHSAALSGFLGILLFIGYGYFDWLHGLFWVILLPIYALSWRETKQIAGSPSSWHDTNDADWLRGMYGQLLFVILGFALLLGGIVISTIGVTKVFVATDLTFLCMPVEMLRDISDMLIPVIAHDRAGFGSALISVGILVLCTSLWGFRAGERWLWYTLAIGALPAFVAGIGTHFMIGYTSFIHLLPLYFLVVLYIVGLILSYRYLTKGRTHDSSNHL